MRKKYIITLIDGVKEKVSQIVKLITRIQDDLAESPFHVGKKNAKFSSTSKICYYDCADNTILSVLSDNLPGSVSDFGSEIYRALLISKG